MAAVLLALAVVSTGLYAGMMVIFLTGIMPGLARLTDPQFVVVMRRINETVPRGVFMTVFAALVAFPAASLAVPGDNREWTATWLLAAGLACGIANHLVTAAGNVPLNNALASAEGSARPDREVRAAFEKRWNQLHGVRTMFSVAAFALTVSSAAV